MLPECGGIAEIGRSIFFCGSLHRECCAVSGNHWCNPAAFLESRCACAAVRAVYGRCAVYTWRSNTHRRVRRSLCCGTFILGRQSCHPVGDRQPSAMPLRPDGRRSKRLECHSRRWRRMPRGKRPGKGERKREGGKASVFTRFESVRASQLRKMTSVDEQYTWCITAY